MTYDDYTDEQLVGLASGGDEEAKEYIIRRYKGLVRSKSRFYFMAGADGDDLVQEGMIGVLKAIRSFDPDKDASFKTFADKCITGQIINAVEKASRRKHMPLNDSVSLSDEGSGDGSGHLLEAARAGDDQHPEKLLIVKELEQEILNDVKGVFSKLERLVLEKYFTGEDYLEIAAELDKSPKTIDNALQRIKRKAKVYFADYF